MLLNHNGGAVVNLRTKTFIRDNQNFDSSEFDSTGVKLYIFMHNEVRDFDKNSHMFISQSVKLISDNI
jgi:hypothetical protein